jgi:hypothetical protein
MPKSVRIPCVGYVFDGTILQAARIDSQYQIVTEVGGAPIDGEPALMPWFTKRRVENALRYLQERHPGFHPNLSTVVYADVKATLERDRKASPRLTRDHILHMLTAGRKVTAADLPAYEDQADKMFDLIEDASRPAQAATAAA